VLPAAVIPAKAGIYSAIHWNCAVNGLDSRFRGNDRRCERDPTPNDTTIGGNGLALEGGILQCPAQHVCFSRCDSERQSKNTRFVTAARMVLIKAVIPQLCHVDNRALRARKFHR